MVFCVIARPHLVVRQAAQGGLPSLVDLLHLYAQSASTAAHEMALHEGRLVFAESKGEGLARLRVIDRTGDLVGIHPP